MEDIKDHVKLSTYITFLARKYEQNSNTTKHSWVQQVFILLLIAQEVNRKFHFVCQHGLCLNSLVSDAISTADFHESFRVFINTVSSIVELHLAFLTFSIEHEEKRKQQVRTLLSIDDCSDTIRHKVHNEARW